MLCHIYNAPDIEQAVKEWETESFKGYGEETRLPDGTVAHDNYECDDGGRGLVRCKKCGALLLVQHSHYEAMDSDHDGYYADWIPVWSEEEADLMNLYLGPRDFAEFPEKHLRKNNGQYFWTKGDIPTQRDIDLLKTAIEGKYGISLTDSKVLPVAGESKNLFEKYEELLLRKNALQKECFQLEQEYIRVFGQDIMALFRMQMECVRKKKTIEFCQIARNHSQEPDERQLTEFLAKETADLQEHFQKIKAEYEASKSTGEVTDSELMEIRKTYRRIAKLIHPDLHPELGDSMLNLWNQITVAYTCNDLESLKELEVLVAAALADASGQEVDIEIPDLENKILKLEAEIADIMGKDPYQYKSLLSDEDAVKEKKTSLQSELENYKLYSKQLDELLAGVLPEGMIVIWDEV